MGATWGRAHPSLFRRAAAGVRGAREHTFALSPALGTARTGARRPHARPRCVLARLEKWSDASPSWTSCPWSTSVGRRRRRLSASPFQVRATVFREGHDQLAAEVVLTAPDGTRRPPVRMTKHESVPDRYDAWVTPDVGGPWTFEVHAWSDPIATWEHDAGPQDPGRRRRGPDVRGGRGSCARRCSPRSTRPAPRASCSRARSKRPVTPAGRRPPGWRCCRTRRSWPRWRRTRSASWSRSRAPTRRTPTARGRCSAAGTSSSRAPRAPRSPPTAR